MKLALRKWQHEFTRRLLAHPGDDFLLVACPAAGKTIGAGAAIAKAMGQRRCDQLIVAAPTVVVRDQWQRELARLGFRMDTEFGLDGWPQWVHGVCATYAQIARRSEIYAEMVARRRTAVILDEVHHAGSELAWGATMRDAFGEAALRLCLSGTPFRSDEDAIPFVRYDQDGRCEPDFAYDYTQAVADGVCRTIHFRPHDGVVTWLEGTTPVTAAFSERVPADARPRRLRACLDPTKPYLRTLLVHAHNDLTKMRQTVPDAAGLIVADSQAHALAVDALLTEITGSLPVLAMSDIPRAHQAIAAFADEDEPWLVSVRMVSEGVDIPRLGVIVWATSASTELMVRQVSGRALRGRGEHAQLQAVVHMPADPVLIRYARRLDLLSGVSGRARVRRESSGGRSRGGGYVPSESRMIDPAPFVQWFTALEDSVGHEAAIARCGWTHSAGTRLIFRWRIEKCHAHTLAAYDACHMAGIDFDELFAGEQYAAARAFVNDPCMERDRLNFRSVDAQPIDGHVPEVVEPVGPRAPVRLARGEQVTLTTPRLPASPDAVKAAEQARERQRGELLQLLSMYAQLRRLVDHAFSVASAHTELARQTGCRIGSDADGEHVATAIDWVKVQLRAFADQHPAEVRELAAQRRRLAAAA